MDAIDQEYIKEFEKLEKEYDNFYNEDIFIKHLHQTHFSCPVCADLEKFTFY